MKKKKIKVKEDLRLVKKSWSHKILTLSGFALLLFLVFSLSIEGIITKLYFSNEIALFLVTILTVSYLAERWIKLKKGRIYENFYSTYIAVILFFLTSIYWLTYLNGIEIGRFITFIVLTHIIVFMFSLITISHSEKLWFIVVSYAFTVIITIFLFAYVYWTLSIFGIGHLQYNDCSNLDFDLQSENWFYFSSVTFYSLGYGDICPVMHWTRLVSQIQVAMGALINTILIGFIFWKIRESETNLDLLKHKNLKR